MRSGWMLVTMMLAASSAAAQSAPPAKDDAPPIRFVWNDRPSIRAGVFRVDLRAKLKGDFRKADQDLEDRGGRYETTLKRVALDGSITNRVEFQIERELQKKNPWRDVFVNVRIATALEVRAGKFKMPFGYERLTSVGDLDFAFRTLLSDIVAPGRDVGVQVHGGLFRRVMTYQAGVFRHDGDNARLREEVFLLPGEPTPKPDRSVAARVLVEPLRHSRGSRDLRRLYLGVAFTQSDVPEGLNSLHGESVFGSEFSERMYVLGHRRRIGTEAAWMPGPFSIKSEYARANEQRKRQGLLDDDISDFVSSAWYLSGTWTVAGRRKDNGEPQTPIFQGGPGAIDLAVRYERMSFRSVLKQGTPFVNPRADPLFGNTETVWTVGVSWYLNKWGKVVVNGLQERFQDPERTAVPGRTTNRAAVLQLQFAM